MRTHPQDCEDMRLAGVFGGSSREIVQVSTLLEVEASEDEVEASEDACAFDHVLLATIG